MALQAAKPEGVKSLEDWAAEQRQPADPPPSRLRAGARAAREWLRRIGYLRARWPRPLGTRPPIGLAVCSIFRDEAPYLAEWVSFHRLQGVERFYLYDNRSSDDWRSVLEPELSEGIVDVRDWPSVPGQRSAYEDCLERHRTDARWIAFIDIDEFLFSPTGRPLPEVLRGFDLHPGVVVSRRTYGTSGWVRPPEGLVTENYVWRGPDDSPADGWVKSIVQPRSAVGCWGASPHHFRLRGTAVGEDRRPVRSATRAPTVDLLRINHYYTRSAEEFRGKIAVPDAATGTLDVRSELPVDAVRDEILAQFAPELRAMLSNRESRAAPTP